MHTVIKACLSIVTVLALSVVPVSAVEESESTMNTTARPESSTQSATNESPEIEATEHSGELLKVEKETLTIDTDEGTKQFSVSANIRIERNGDAVPISQLKPGDKVTIKALGTEALSVSATAGSLIEKAITAGIIALLALILLLLVRRIIRKRNKGFVKTTPTNLTSGE